MNLHRSMAHFSMLVALSTTACGGYGEEDAVTAEGPTEETASALTGSEILNMGRNYVGTPYELRSCAAYGATNTLDCDGFTWLVFHRLGKHIGCWTEQTTAGRRVDLSNKQPGDLLFFRNAGGLYHVGIFAGDGKILHASTFARKVVTSELRYLDGLYMARRID